jgi:asparagine synthase (glutamine-hydrolysing)
MFGYIGLIWDPADVQQRDVAHSISLEIARGTAWRTAFDRPGIRILCTGERAGSMHVCSLHDARGVVLGTLFPRISDSETLKPLISLRRDESMCIAASRGRALIESYWGRYVAFLHEPDGETKVIRDPTGTLECLDISVRKVRLLFSSLNQLPLSVRTQLSVNWRYVAGALSFPILDQRGTGLCEVTRVLAGECLEIDGKRTSRRFYWTPAAFARQEAIDDPALAADRLRQTVRACTYAWAACYPKLMLKLSGGLDSSIVLACLADAPSRPVVTCGNYFCASDPNSDERRYARIAAESAQLPLAIYEPDPSFDARRLLSMPAFHSPSEHLISLACNEPAWTLALEQGALALFTGAGGDQTFFVASLSHACADALYRNGVRRGLLPLAMTVSRRQNVSVWRTLANGVRQAWAQDRWQPLLVGYRPARFLSAEAADAASKGRMYWHPWLDDFEGVAPGKMVHMLNLADVFISNAGPFTRPDHPDYVHPLCSQPLKELVLRMPTDVLAAGGHGRGLARSAFASVLPHEIRSRRDKGGPDLYVKHLIARNLPLMREVVLDGVLVKERVVDPQSVDALLGSALIKEGHATLEACLLFSTEAWASGWTSHRAAARAA